jgi:8-oxo-dGTP pyrophosphatase MutT (NUDIX family)
MLDFNDQRPAVPPRDAATVVVLRQGERGLELFSVKRHARSGFLGGAVVFPGGKRDEADGSEHWAGRSSGLSARALSLAPSESDALGFAVAALRELLEEAAILPVVGDGLDDRAVVALRGELEARRQAGTAPAVAFAELCGERGLQLDTARLEALSRWITPAAEMRRYDTRFYLLPLPAGQHGRHDERETTSSLWARPADILDAWSRSELFLAPPTSRTLELLAGARDLDAALELARSHPLEPICPHFARDGEQVILALPGDPLYPQAHPVPVDPGAPTRFVLQDGRFISRRI